MWHINLLIASAAASGLSDMDDRRFFLESTIPAVVTIVPPFALWLVAHRRAIRDCRVGLRSLLILVAALSPGLAMLRLVYWDYLWGT